MEPGNHGNRRFDLRWALLAKVWKSYRGALAASRLEDDADLPRLLAAERAQREARLVLCAVAERGDGGSVGDAWPDLEGEADLEAVRARLGVRRIQLWAQFWRANGTLLRAAWSAQGRTVRRSLLLVVLALSAATAFAVLDRPKNLARGREWTASSSARGAARSGRLSASRARYFFHTKRENGPFIEIDLEQVTTVQRVEVTNRTDCCQTRALPLLVEASDDRQHWTLLAQRDRAFRRWQATFAPRRARWLRLRVPRVTTLHLRDVAVY